MTRAQPPESLPQTNVHPPSTDGQVVAQVLAGDIEAFETLVQRYQNEFARYATYMTGSVEEAADVIQESLFRAYKSLRRCRDPENFKGWLFTIVSNQCKTHLGRERGRQVVPLDKAPPQVMTDAASTDERVERQDLQQTLRDALRRLPEEQREVLVLKYIEDLSLHDMVKRLGASPSALKMRLMRGRAALRAQLNGAPE